MLCVARSEVDKQGGLSKSKEARTKSLRMTLKDNGSIILEQNLLSTHGT